MTDHQLLDERLLKPLLEQSQDIQSDAMAASKDQLAGLVELGQEARAHGEVDTVDVGQVRADRWDGLSKKIAGAGGLVAASGIGAALLGIFASPAYAATGSVAGDIMILQTAASIEVLAVSTYTTALTLPYIGGSSANAIVTAFVKETKTQHAAHLGAFNNATTKLGGKAQNSPDPKYVPTVNSAVTKITKDSTSAGLMAVVSLATTLEEVASETYVNDVAYLQNAQAKALMASIMGVEAQHVAVLLAVAALVKGGAADLIAIPSTVAAVVANDTKLPAAAGSVGFPNAFYSISMASPASEGAVS